MLSSAVSVRLGYDEALALKACKWSSAALSACYESEAVVSVREDGEVGEHPIDGLAVELVGTLKQEDRPVTISNLDNSTFFT